ncbi:MAG: 4Fe-4S ferredoxin, partial [Verrucomicrobiota bacterium]
MTSADQPDIPVERPRMDADIICVGFGPASGGFLTTLSRAILNEDGSTAIESPSAPGLPLQVLCYERSDDLGFGVSGVVTRARGLRESFPNLDSEQIPMAAPVTDEKILYLLDPVGASRRPLLMRAADVAIRAAGGILGVKDDAMKLPWTPDFLNKHGGVILSMGQFTQWVAQQVMGSGAAQIWPGSPVGEAILEDGGVAGVRLVDQGATKDGNPSAGLMPGMQVRA